jgi:glucose/arabinose dehydrogenase
MKKIIFLSLILISYSTFSKTYETEGQKYTVEKIFEGKDIIWGFDFLDDKNANELLFSERDGKLKYLDLKTLKSHDVSGAPSVFADGQGGLLDVYTDHKNRDIYLTYSEPVAKGATTSLFRGKLSNDKKKLEGSRIFQAQAIANTGQHFGSRVAIDKDGFIFIGIGERNQRDRAQDLSNHQGKILRLTKEGRAPADNPFVNTKGALPEIWSYGHRNPQGLIFDTEGVLLDAEFGPRGGDEVNLIQKGANYGWPVITYGKEYWGPSIGPGAKEGMMQPLYYWTPSISPSGMMFYSGKTFPKFTGNLFLATLSGAHLHRIVFDKNRKLLKEEKLLTDLDERFRQVKMGPDGLIYLSTDSGKILRVKPL